LWHNIKISEGNNSLPEKSCYGAAHGTHRHL
jgi:hypothetical protein